VREALLLAVLAGVLFTLSFAVPVVPVQVLLMVLGAVFLIWSIVFLSWAVKPDDFDR
jgi:hypothetical protein